MTLPPWPADSPTCGHVRLRAVEERDGAMARQLSTDPYVPQTGSLPGNVSASEAGAWIARQQGRYAEGTGFSFTIARGSDDVAIGHCGLWLKDLDEGRASAGYAISPPELGRGYAADALAALTEFAWTVPGVQWIELFIEPWNAASIRTAEHVGYLRESLLPEHQMIGGQRRDVFRYAIARSQEVGTGDEDKAHGAS